MADPADETPHPRTGDPPVVFDADGAPRSRRYGDVYFSKAGGLEETRAVFLAGCGLPQRWTGRRAFTVAELGFGTGLNIAALLELWRAERPPGAHLSIFSVEAEPIGAADAGRALAAFPNWRRPRRCSPAAGPAGRAVSTASTCRSSARASTSR